MNHENKMQEWIKKRNTIIMTESLAIFNPPHPFLLQKLKFPPPTNPPPPLLHISFLFPPTGVVGIITLISTSHLCGFPIFSNTILRLLGFIIFRMGKSMNIKKRNCAFTGNLLYPASLLDLCRCHCLVKIYLYIFTQ